MGSRKLKIQCKEFKKKIVFEENHNLFIESFEVLEWVKYASVQTKKAA